MDAEEMYRNGIEAGRKARLKYDQSQAYFGGFVDGYFQIGSDEPPAELAANRADQNDEES